MKRERQLTQILVAKFEQAPMQYCLGFIYYLDHDIPILRHCVKSYRLKFHVTLKTLGHVFLCSKANAI